MSTDRLPIEPDANDTTESPWVTRATRLVYQNPWIRVREDDVIRPDGQPGIYGVVEYRSLAIGVLPVADDGSIWLVGQYRYPLNCYKWEIPEGGSHPGESPEVAARRELQEETGLTAGRLEPLGAAVHLSNSVSNEVGYLFRASELIDGPASPEGTERLSLRLVAWDQVVQMLDAGQITDSLTVIALLHEARCRQRSSR